MALVMMGGLGGEPLDEHATFGDENGGNKNGRYMGERNIGRGSPAYGYGYAYDGQKGA